MAAQNYLVLGFFQVVNIFEGFGAVYCSLLNIPTVRSRDGVLPVSFE